MTATIVPPDTIEAEPARRTAQPITAISLASNVRKCCCV